MTVTEPTSEKLETTSASTGTENEAGAGEQELVEDEMLVEEISIDGMCGVY